MKRIVATMNLFLSYSYCQLKHDLTDKWQGWTRRKYRERRRWEQGKSSIWVRWVTGCGPPQPRAVHGETWSLWTPGLPWWLGQSHRKFLVGADRSRNRSLHCHWCLADQGDQAHATVGLHQFEAYARHQKYFRIEVHSLLLDHQILLCFFFNQGSM